MIRAGFHLEAGMTVGLFGGSFNPAHEGHAHVVETARKRLGLHKVIWLVSPQNPLKSSRETAPLTERMNGVRALARPGDVVSDIETRLGTVYTVETLRALKARFPTVRFVWIMGADSLAGFHLWRDWKEIARLMPMAIVARPAQAMKSRLSPAARYLKAYQWPQKAGRRLAQSGAPAWIYLNAPLNPLSSTAIRAQKATLDAAEG